MKPLRLRGRKTAERVMRKGRLWKGLCCTVRWLPGAPRAGDEEGVYLGTYASGKLEKRAVVRNRMRRRCREALRVELLEAQELPTVQLLLSPRSSSLEADFADIRADVRTFLSMLRKWQQPQPPVPASSASR